MPAWKGIVGKGFTASDFSQYVTTVTFNAWRPQFVVLHNTAVPTFADWHKVPGEQRMKNLESFYRDTQKWSAGPHLFVADDLIWVFTPVEYAGCTLAILERDCLGRGNGRRLLSRATESRTKAEYNFCPGHTAFVDGIGSLQPASTQRRP